MITTEDSTIRVERVERRMWVETGAGTIALLALAIYFAVNADRAIEYLWGLGLILIGVVVAIMCVRRRQVCVIEPTRFGFGYLNKNKMWWFDRDRLASVRVRKDLLLQVRFYGGDGKMFATSVFAYFDPKELRQAFESAGIPVR